MGRGRLSCLQSFTAAVFLFSFFGAGCADQSLGGGAAGVCPRFPRTCGSSLPLFFFFFNLLLSEFCAGFLVFLDAVLFRSPLEALASISLKPELHTWKVSLAFVLPVSQQHPAETKLQVRKNL